MSLSLLSISHILLLIALLVVIISSYTSFVVIDRMLVAKKSKKMLWLIVTSFIFATGVFSMHLIALIASHLYMTISYNLLLLLLSFISCFLASIFAIYIIQLTPFTMLRGLSSGVILGVGILFLHYVSILSINEVVIIQFDSIYFYLSILISVILLWVANKVITKKRETQFISFLQNIPYSVLIGILIFTLHMLSMEATTIIEKHKQHIGFSPLILGIVLSIVSLLIMIITLISAFLDFRIIQNEKKLLYQLKLSEERYRTLVEKSPYPVVVQKYDYSIVYANKAALLLLKAKNLNEIKYKPILDFFHPDYKELAIKRIERIKQGEELDFYYKKIVSLDGSVKDVEIAGNPIIIFDNKPAIQLTIRDITIEKKIKEELEDSKQRYMSLFEYNPDPVFSIDLKGFFTEINRAFLEITKYKKSEVIGKHFKDFVDSDSLETASINYEEVIKKGIPKVYEVIAVKKDGSKFPVSIKTSPIIIDNKIIGGFAMAKDLTNEKEYLNRIEQLAYNDYLTGIPNRLSLYRHLQMLIDNYRDSKKEISIMMIDIDNFKTINDTFGHNIGDLVIKEAISRLQKCISHQDIIARIGGDEFIIVLENKTMAETELVAKRIIEIMKDKIQILTQEISLSVSIGISKFKSKHTKGDQVIKEADIAMYIAKEKGKNNYQFFTNELESKVNRKNLIISSLQHALDRGEFKIHYQILVELQTKKLSGVEALLRWYPPFGIVSPDDFVPIAEETGLIVPIGEWVIREACLQIKKWENHPILNVPISVNISTRQIKEPRFVSKVKQIIKETKIDPAFLELEITESIMFDVENFTPFIKELREIGIRIAVDDFGRRYSSLHLITNLDFDTLKFDKSLVSNKFGDGKISILNMVIQGLNEFKRIVIEGIETEEQANAFKALNTVGQGFYFCKPLPPEELEQKAFEIVKV